MIHIVCTESLVTSINSYQRMVEHSQNSCFQMQAKGQPSRQVFERIAVISPVILTLFCIWGYYSITDGNGSNVDWVAKV